MAHAFITYILVDLGLHPQIEAVADNPAFGEIIGLRRWAKGNDDWRVHTIQRFSYDKGRAAARGVQLRNANRYLILYKESP